MRKFFLAILLFFIIVPIISFAIQLSWFWNHYSTISERIFYAIPFFVAPIMITTLIIYAIRFHGKSSMDIGVIKSALVLFELVNLSGAIVLLFFFSLFLGGFIHQSHVLWQTIVMGIFELFLLYALSSFFARLTLRSFQVIGAIIFGFYINFILSPSITIFDWKMFTIDVIIIFLVVFPLARWLLEKGILSSRMSVGIRSGVGPLLRDNNHGF